MYVPLRAELSTVSCSLQVNLLAISVLTAVYWKLLLRGPRDALATGLALCHESQFLTVLIWQSNTMCSTGPGACQQQVLGPFNSARYGFHLMKWVLDPSFKKWLVTPITFVPLLHEQAYLIRAVVACRVLKVLSLIQPCLLVGWFCKSSLLKPLLCQSYHNLQDSDSLCSLYQASTIQKSSERYLFSVTYNLPNTVPGRRRSLRSQ